MNRVVHFELPADNPERAVEFYKKSFGWQIQKWPGPQDYWLVTTGADGDPGINGGILRRQHPGAGTCNTVSVASVDDAVATITKNGGKVALAKMADSWRGLSGLLHGHGRKCVRSAATGREREIDWLLRKLDSIRVNEFGAVPGSMGRVKFDTAWNDTAFSFSHRCAFTIL